MIRADLEHAIRAACDVAGDNEVWVFGSQSILGQHPDAPESLRMSIEVDVDPRNFPDRVELIEGALGEGSQFHRAYGFYVHGVSIATAILPRGWQERARKIQNANTGNATGWCLESHDLAASKLAAWRDKDREFVRALLRERVIRAGRLVRLVGLLPLPEERLDELCLWVDGTEREIVTGQGGGSAHSS